jgi:hypothetical protein
MRRIILLALTLNQRIVVTSAIHSSLGSDDLARAIYK